MGSQGISEVPRQPQVERRPLVENGRLSSLLWRHVDALLLASTLLVMTSLNMLWVALDSRPPYWDMARHLGDSVVYWHALTGGHPLRFLTSYVYYPPFAYWVTDGFYVVLGTAQWVAVLSQAAFAAVLVYSTYGVGKLLWSRRVGLLAAYFVATTPMLVSLFKWYMLDAPLTAMAALALYLLLRSESFSSRKFSLLFGAVCGLGMLTKWTFPLAIALPAAVAVATPIRIALFGRGIRPLVHAISAGVLAFAICGAWYVHNYSALTSANALYNNRAARIEGDPSISSLRSLLWYAWNLLDEQLYVIPFLLFVGGLIVVVRKNDAAARNFYPVLMIVGTYIAFTLLDNKDYRFTLPMLPAVAIVAVSSLEYVRPGLRRWVTGAIVVYGAAAFVAISFGTRLLPKDLVIHLRPHPYTSDLVAFMPGYDAGSATRAQGIVLFAQHGWLVGPPRHEQWFQKEIFEEIAARRPRSTFWYTGGDSIWFNTWGTRYYSLRYRLAWVPSPADAQFLIVRGSAPAANTRGFLRIKAYVLPDGEPLSLYERA